VLLGLHHCKTPWINKVITNTNIVDKFNEDNVKICALLNSKMNSMDVH